MMSPIKEVDRIGATCPFPVDLVEGIEVKKEVFLVEQQWENAAPQSVTHQSGLFNTEMDMTSGLTTADSVIDSTRMDPSATSTVDLAELFPDLQEILNTKPDVEGVSSPIATEGDGVADLSDFAPSPEEPKGGLDGGRRGQLASTSSCSEMSDYEEGLSPAEVDSTLEHFFNTFTDLEEFLVPAEETGPTSTVDAAAVRSLIDNPTTTDNQSSLDYLLTTKDDSFALSTANVTTQVKSEDVEEENTCHVAKKSRTSKSGASRVTACSEDDVYRRRRVKNNVACKRARQNRKKRENDLALTAVTLEKENAELRAKIEELTEIAEISRRALITVLAK
ncbi:thyrotroph embryonic factor-like isoform X1 [Lytechinus variegatus]|uniref:thyrotroph embryonic factor-like isoform X1 n=2 Tax=Lytechinus variegatus TaxID=7654 RepID=UPI001BB13570|nr:thyrotroph embryonic factor-like isoform X1 [Lytechinus variegatus]